MAIDARKLRELLEQLRTSIEEDSTADDLAAAWKEGPAAFEELCQQAHEGHQRRMAILEELGEVAGLVEERDEPIPKHPGEEILKRLNLWRPKGR